MESLGPPRPGSPGAHRRSSTRRHRLVATELPARRTIVQPQLTAALTQRLRVTSALCCLLTKACSMRALKLFPASQRLLAAWLLCAATSGWALELQKQEFSDEQIFSTIVNRFKKPLQHRFDPAATGDQKPVLLLGPALTFGKRMVSKSFTHVTQQELVAKQEAVFILITKAAPDLESNALYVDYDIPSNASFGVLKVYPKDGVLVAETEDSFRSSSGARATYGKLYDGVACRDNTEMTYRWNYYERRGASGRCLDAMFTEFTGWFEPSVKPVAK